MNAHALASEKTTASRIVEFTRHAIRSWRELAGLDSTGANIQSTPDRELQLVA